MKSEIQNRCKNMKVKKNSCLRFFVTIMTSRSALGLLALFLCLPRQFFARAVCNIPKLPLSELVDAETFPDVATIYVEDGVHVGRQQILQQLSGKEQLSTNYGETVALLSSSNAYSHGRIHMSINEYFEHILPSTNNSKANETYYLFGGNTGGIWDILEESYAVPPCRYCKVAGAVTLGIGGEHSGVAFHLHGPGFSESIIGTKQWYVFPPELTPLVRRFDANLTMHEWVQRVYPCLRRDCPAPQPVPLSSFPSDFNSPKTTEDSENDHSTLEVAVEMNGADKVQVDECLCEAPYRTLFSLTEWELLRAQLLECVIIPGEVLYFPAMAMHATLNLQPYNVFVSDFLDPQLMK